MMHLRTLLGVKTKNYTYQRKADWKEVVTLIRSTLGEVERREELGQY